MAEIIKIEPEIKERVFHKDCGATIEFGKSDIYIQYIHSDYTGGGVKAEYIKCPHCNKEVQVHKNIYTNPDDYGAIHSVKKGGHFSTWFDKLFMIGLDS